MSDPLFVDPDQLFDESHCDHCICGAGLDFDFTFAFQPILDAEEGTVLAYEALVRGINGEGAGYVLDQVNKRSMYRFDQACRVKAVKLASELGMKEYLSINFMPNAVYKAETCIQTTLAAAKRYQFDTSKLIFEFTEVENLASTEHLRSIIDAYHEMGFSIALDDYGAGYSRMNLLIEARPKFLKLDMALIRDVHKQPRKQAMIEGTLLSMFRLGVKVIAEGVETEEEYRWCRVAGIRYYQGYLLAKPGFESLPKPYIPEEP
ncbi:MAG: EAL domain-containing protein [Oleiphilaceae bacterium]|nr:EAL domain-containing protein [Oleiphilaceae bacterium]